MGYCLLTRHFDVAILQVAKRSLERISVVVVAEIQLGVSVVVKGARAFRSAVNCT